MSNFLFNPQAILDREDKKKLTKQIQTTYDRSRQSIEKWISAWVNAQDQQLLYTNQLPYKKPLIDLYEMIEIDGHLSAVVQNRKAKVLGEQFAIEDTTGEVNDELTELLQRSWFTDDEIGFMTLAMDAKFFGHSLIGFEELTEEGEVKECVLVERRNVVPEYNLVRRNPYDQTGVDVSQSPFCDKYIMVYQKSHGLYLKVTPDVLFRRSGIQYWTEHAEVYSIDMLLAKIANPDDNNEYSRVLDELEQTGRGRKGVFGIGDEIEAISQSSANSYEIYDKLVEKCENTISRLIVGQTGTSSLGTNYREAANHHETAEEIAEKDREFVEGIVNDRLLKILPKLSSKYSSLEGCKFKFVVDKKAPLKERIELFKALDSAGYTLSEEDIKKEFGWDVIKKEGFQEGF